jgi:hypothetical protein
MGRIGLVAVVSGLLLLTGCARSAPASTAAPPAAPAAVTRTGQTTAAPASPTPAATAIPATGQASSRPSPAATPRPSQVGSGPLVLEVSEPAEDLVEVPAGTRRVTVAGRSRPSAVVSVNGQLVDLDGRGAFRAEVPLDEDVTLVEVVASDASGAELRVQRVVVRE